MGFSPTQSRPGLSVQGEGARRVIRALPDEVPVAFVFDGTTQAVMMATPADIADFAYGFAVTEGIVTTQADIEGFEIAEHGNGIEARFWLRGDRQEALAARRRYMAGPVGCGLCGIDSLEQAVRPVPSVAHVSPAFTAQEIARATDALSACQPLHDLTRATHAAGFILPGAGVVMAREDVGRHNALDKLIGALWRAGIDPAEGGIVMTSRLSVELVQKCAVAGCGLLVAVSAPTAHALRLAESAGLTLAAFARGGGFDLYSHPHRIPHEVPDVA
ncbi:Formate dehydrogenase chain D [Roseovarius sp. AK1035]|jgi:FdhD protein|uniref:formate dehydrogenase accessory sulfurtransferase FdhD n=1 Tax=Roseovarius TaxID=74030 RepID=UPI0002F6C726|nr:MULTISPECIES: formate dehydrogenase accessory sulfurtransferase FdhD [Roseovarius]AWZ21488.1 Formate dehydrogenase chain D [Roseovarius sp. AK1035]MBW4974956.1 formate dehydrogenase accessory sulfurtransferase FdhD [Roseovarius mucosus]